MSVNAVRGMKDLLGSEMNQWHSIEKIITSVLKDFGFGEIRTPVLEKVEVFSQAVGEDTDIVEKQMYKIAGDGEEVLVMRPEGTASFMRAIIEHGMHHQAHPQRYYYYLPMFRHERPQKGRLRQFHQFGAEVIHDGSAEVDAEVIFLLKTIYDKFGLTEYEIRINSAGCENCRPEYSKKLKKFLEPHLKDMCELCQKRFERAPIRLFDCKNDGCQKHLENAPRLLQNLCVDCSTHQNKLEVSLKLLKVPYIVDTSIVRGLDYYRRTAFEFTSNLLGAQSALVGGGRYDGLAARFGEKPFPAIGFGLGMERLVLALEAAGKLPKAEPQVKFYFIALGEEAFKHFYPKSAELKAKGAKVEMSYEPEKNLKWYLKQADRLGSDFALILGENELKSGNVLMKDMKNGTQQEIPLNNLSEEILRRTPLAT